MLTSDVVQSSLKFRGASPFLVVKDLALTRIANSIAKSNTWTRRSRSRSRALITSIQDTSLVFHISAATLDDVAVVELYLPGRHTLWWSLPSTASGRTATLQGTFASADAHPWPAHPAQVSFAMPAEALPSGLQVDQLKISGETYKPYTGVHGRAFRRIEWRVEWKGAKNSGEGSGQ